MIQWLTVATFLSSCGLHVTTVPNSSGQSATIGTLTPNANYYDEIASGPLASGGYRYTPSGIAGAYQITSALGDGTGQTIALIDDLGSPNVQSDLASFSQEFNLPSAQLTVAYPEGTPAWDDTTCHFGTTEIGFSSVCAAWAAEISLDVQMAHAIAPGANLLLVIVNPLGATTVADYLQLKMTAVDYAVAQGATVVSMSWGYSEYSGINGFDTHFNVPGVTFVAAAGDSPGQLSWPGTSPYVLSVGGTQLEYDNSFRDESAWYRTGGGVSQYVPIPSYQVGIGGTASTTNRSVPDVAAMADGGSGFWVYDSINGPAFNGDTRPLVNGMPQAVPNTRYNWIAGDGTSAATPFWAGIIALANGKRTTPLGDVHAALYGKNAATGFLDITLGCIDPYSPSPICAGTGYDLATGLGVPIGSTLVPYLISQ